LKSASNLRILKGVRKMSMVASKKVALSPPGNTWHENVTTKARTWGIKVALNAMEIAIKITHILAFVTESLSVSDVSAQFGPACVCVPVCVSLLACSERRRRGDVT
jgi:hypothetical protein